MTVRSNKELNRAVGVGGVFILAMTGVAFTVGALSNVYFFNNPVFAKISMAAAGGNIDKIIPLYINSALPQWFVYIFMLTLLSAAMSTSSSQFHAMGTGFGRDLFERTLLRGKHPQATVGLTRLGILIGVVITVLLSYKLPGNIIAIATAIFFGLCASTFLPSFMGALFWKGMTKAGAIASMITGFIGTAFWLLFVLEKQSSAIGLCKFIFNKPTVASYPWSAMDPIVVILPISFVVAIAVSLFTKKPPKEHIAACFKHF
jgi:solute:Na+ symporter, SSS family